MQATREANLPYYGTVRGHLFPHRQHLYQIESVIEKPTPTEAEPKSLVPGLRAGHYLCFVGLHVLTPTGMEILGKQVQKAGDNEPLQLSPALAELAARERYLALELSGTRYNTDVKHGLLIAQLALGLDGEDRDELLTQLVELLARRENTRG